MTITFKITHRAVPRNSSLRAPLLALTAALCCLAVAAAPASAGALPGAPQCLDGTDNDGDAKVDLRDPECESPVDNDEAHGGGSKVLVSFLTTYDPDGHGGSAPIVCAHSVLAVPDTPISSVVLTPMDVSHSGCSGAPDDVSVGVRVPLVGLTPDTNRPTIRIKRLDPSLKGLRIEAVAPDRRNSERVQTLGYDAPATVPADYTLALDTRDQDGQTATDDAKITQTVIGPGSELALVTDNYRPGPGDLSDRQALTQNRLTFQSVDSDTHVPATVDVDLSVGETRQQLEIKRSGQSTVMDFLIADPNDDPKVWGTLGGLPPKTTVTLTDAGDRTQIAYDANQAVATARANVSMVRNVRVPHLPGQPSTQPKRITVNSQINGLPGGANTTEDAKLVYAPRDDTVDYSASARATSATVTVNDDAPLFGRAKYLKLTLDDLPKDLHADLSRENFKFATQAATGIGLVTLTALPAPPQNPVATCIVVVCADSVSMTDNASTYSVAARIHRLKKADLQLEPDLDVTLDTAPEMLDPDSCEFTICRQGVARDLVPVWRSPFSVSLNLPRKPGDYGQGQQQIAGEISRLQPSTRLQIGPSTPGFDHIAYSDEATTGPNSGPDVRVDATNMPGLPTGANGVQADELHVGLANMPRRLDFSYRRGQRDGEPGGFPFVLNAAGDDDVISRLDVLLTSGPNEYLPEAECVNPDTDPNCSNYRELDGLLLRDNAQEYLIHVRLRDLRSLTLNKFSGGGVDYLAAELRANVQDNHERALRVDMKTDKQAVLGGDGTYTGTESILATLDKLPKHVELKTIVGRGRTKVQYEAPETVDQFDYHKAMRWHGHDSTDSDEYLTVYPMPRTLSICKQDKDVDCAQGVFDDKIEWASQPHGDFGISELRADKGGSMSIHSEPASHLHYLNHSGTYSPMVDQLSLYTDYIALQSYSEHWDCHFEENYCARGYLGIDTGWNGQDQDLSEAAAEGVIQSYDTRLNLNQGFASAAHLFAFEKSGVASGQVLVDGPVHCSPGTNMYAGGEEITDKFCEGHLTEWGWP